MALSPQEAAALDEREMEIVADLEKRIDQQLRSEYVVGRGPVNVPVEEFDKRILNAVMERYRRAGWTEVDLNDTRRSKWHLILDTSWKP